MPSCRCPHTDCSLSAAGLLQRRVLAVAGVKLTAAAMTSGGGQGRGRSCRRRLPQHPAVDEPPLPVQCLCAGLWLRLPPRRREPPLRRNQLTDWGRAALPPIAAAGRVSLAAICRLSDPGALVPAAALATPACRGSPLPAAHRLRSSRARSRSFQRMALVPATTAKPPSNAGAAAAAAARRSCPQACRGTAAACLGRHRRRCRHPACPRARALGCGRVRAADVPRTHPPGNPPQHPAPRLPQPAQARGCTSSSWKTFH